MYYLRRWHLKYLTFEYKQIKTEKKTLCKLKKKLFDVKIKILKTKQRQPYWPMDELTKKKRTFEGEMFTVVECFINVAMKVVVEA